MQVTGSSSLKNRRLSILIRTDGLSFFVTDKEKMLLTIDLDSFNEGHFKNSILDIRTKYGAFKEIGVIVSTNRNVVIPTEVYSEEHEVAYLLSKGIHVDNSKDYVFRSTKNECVYIWLEDKIKIDLLQHIECDKRYFHIFEPTQTYGSITLFDSLNKQFLIDKDGDLLYVTIFDKNRLLFQDCFKSITVSDDIFYIKSVLVTNNFFNKKDKIVIRENNKYLYSILKDFSTNVKIVKYSEMLNFLKIV